MINIGIIGDYDEGAVSHPPTNSSIGHAAASLSIEADVTWLPTESFLTPGGKEALKGFDAFWASGGEYKSMNGAITAIHIVRETGKPLIGT